MMNEKTPNLEKILKEWAQRLGVSVEQAWARVPNEPLFLQSARQRAKDGKTVEQVIAEDLQRLRASRYPGPECFEPHEVEMFAEGKLLQARLNHADECVACSTLLKASQPNKEQLEQFLEHVRAMCIRVTEKKHSDPSMPSLADIIFK